MLGLAFSNDPRDFGNPAPYIVRERPYGGFGCFLPLDGAINQIVNFGHHPTHFFTRETEHRCIILKSCAQNFPQPTLGGNITRQKYRLQQMTVFVRYGFQVVFTGRLYAMSRKHLPR